MSYWKTGTGPDIINTRCANFNRTSSLISRPFIQQEFPLFDFAREHCFYHLDICPSNSSVARVIFAADFLDLIFRAPTMLICQGAAGIKEYWEKIISDLSSFYRHCVSYDYAGFEIISDVVKQIVSGSTQGWLYRLGQMRAYVEILTAYCPMMDVGNADIEISQQRKLLKKGLMAYREGNPKFALQAYIDSCGIPYLKSMEFEKVTNFSREERLSAFAAIVDYICKREDFWLVVIFGYFIKESSDDAWLRDFLLTISSLLVFQAQLHFSWANYDAAAELYMTVGAAQSDR